MGFFLTEEFMGYHLDPWSDELDVDPHPAITADDGSGVLPAMRNRKMIFFAFQERLTGVGDTDLFQWKIREKERQQVAACQCCKRLKGWDTSLFKGTFSRKKDSGSSICQIPNFVPWLILC
jgi:hypothetical protein